MRGTPRRVNRALTQPALFLGCERTLAIIALLFWSYIALGMIPHWYIIIPLIGLAITILSLRFLAKKDPQWLAVFRANSRFLLFEKLYQPQGYTWHTKKAKAVYTLPKKLTNLL